MTMHTELWKLAELKAECWCDGANPVVCSEMCKVSH